MSEKKKRAPRYALSATIEVTRSFSYKKPLDKFEMADFFCSAKQQTRLEDAEQTADALHRFCQAEVKKSVEQFMRTRKLKKAGPLTTPAAVDAVVAEAKAEAAVPPLPAKKETNENNLHDAGQPNHFRA